MCVLSYHNILRVDIAKNKIKSVEIRTVTDSNNLFQFHQIYAYRIFIVIK